MDKKRIGFLGFGHMAQVLFEAMAQAGWIQRSQTLFIQRDSHKAKANEMRFGIVAASLDVLIRESDVIFLCVKPQQISEVLEQLQPFSLKGKWVISILAGISVSFLEKNLGNGVFVMRAMPNIASEVNEGMTIFSYGETCSDPFKEFANQLFSSVGKVSSQPDFLMDIASSMAGSGPGFVARLIQAMAEAGKKQGMEESEAVRIAAQAFIGAGKLIANGANCRDLIQQIATPQGMTAVGFLSMDQTHLDELFIQVIQAAAARSKELSRF